MRKDKTSERDKEKGEENIKGEMKKKHEITKKNITRNMKKKHGQKNQQIKEKKNLVAYFTAEKNKSTLRSSSHRFDIFELHSL